MTEPDARAQALLDANAAFYRAFEQLELPAMRDCWVADGQCICIHPGWPLCRGWGDVEESWRRIFENTPYIEFRVTVLDYGLAGDRGWALCEEAILQSTPEGISRSVVLSTNMYTETADGWRMVLHHGSPVLRRQPVEGE